MSNSGWTADPNTITIPANAGPGDPRIVITAAPPDSIGYDADAAILFYWNETDYWYIGIANFGDPNNGYFVRGFSSTTTGDLDHVEEISYSNSTRVVAWDRVTRDFPATHQAIERLTADQYLLSAPTGTHQLTASDYTVEQNGAQTSVSRGDIDLAGFATVGGITTTETAVSTLTAGALGSFATNRRYRVEFVGRIRSTVAGDRYAVRIRQDNATGTSEGYFGDSVIGVANIDQPVNVWCYYIGRGIAAEQVVLSIVRTAGTGTLQYTPIEGVATDKTTTSLS